MGTYTPTPPQQPPPPDPRAQQRLLREAARQQRQRLRAMRPTSLVGPLLLVSLGVVALLVELGRLPTAGLVHLLARWWPALLLLAGLVRLAEWVADQARRRRAQALGQVAMPTSLGGAATILLPLILVAGVLAGISQHHLPGAIGRDLVLNQDNWDQFLGDKHESDSSLTQPFPQGGGLTVNCPHGDVIVNANSTDGQLHLAAHTTVYTRSDRDAEHRSSEVTPNIHPNGKDLVVDVPSANSTRVDLTLSIPATAPLFVNANQGDVTVTGQEAPVAIIANHGDVIANDITGPLAVHINNGESSFSAHNDVGPISLEGRSSDLTLSDTTGNISLDGDFFGTVHVEHSRGSLRLHTGRIDLAVARVDGNLDLSPGDDLTGENLAGPLALNTRNRNVNLERVSGDIAITNRNGSVTLVAVTPLGNINVDNRIGAVDVTLPSDAGFTLDATTTDADLSNAFRLKPSDNQAQTGTHASGTVGSGGPLVRLNTTQGDLTLQRGSNAPLPPLPPSTPRVVSPRIVIPKIVIPQVTTPQVVIPKIVIPEVVVPGAPDHPSGSSRRHPNSNSDDDSGSDEKTF